MNAQDTKLKVLMAAAELISSQGYHNVSVREICETAGVTKPVLYYYFKDKEAVLSELINEGHRRIIDLINHYVKPDASFIENLDGIYRVYLNYNDKYPYLIKVSTHVQLTPLPDNIKKLSRKKSDEVIELIKSVFTKGIKEKYLNKNIEVEMLIYSLIAPLGVLIAQTILFNTDVKPLKVNLKKYFEFWKSQFLRKEK